MSIGKGNDIDELRIKKRDGFHGTVVPIMAVLRGTSAVTVSNYTTSFFIAQRSYIVLQVRARWEVKETSGTPTLQVKKVPDGTATASGSNLLKAGIDMTLVADTIVTGNLVDNQETLRIVDGDALSLEATGSVNEVDGLTVSVLLRAI